MLHIKVFTVLEDNATYVKKVVLSLCVPRGSQMKPDNLRVVMSLSG